MEEDLEKCSVRRLKYICAQEGIAVPLMPTRHELITAIRSKSAPQSQPVNPSPPSRKQQKPTSENFETPKVGINAPTELTPVYNSYSTQMRLKQAASTHAGVSPPISRLVYPPQNRSNQKAIKYVFVFIILFNVILFLVSFVL